MTMSMGLGPKWRPRGKIKDKFPMVKIWERGIGLIKFLFRSVAKVKPLAL